MIEESASRPVGVSAFLPRNSETGEVIEMNGRSSRCPAFFAAILWVGLILFSADTGAQSNDEFVTHHERGVELLRQGDVNAAIAEFRTAIRLRPTAVIAHKNLGNALLIKGMIDEAIAEFQTAFS